MLNRKQKKSSRKNMANRHVLKHFSKQSALHLANTKTASPVLSRNQTVSSSVKRGNSRGILYNAL